MYAGYTAQVQLQPHVVVEHSNSKKSGNEHKLGDMVPVIIVSEMFSANSESLHPAANSGGKVPVRP